MDWIPIPVAQVAQVITDFGYNPRQSAKSVVNIYLCKSCLSCQKRCFSLLFEKKIEKIQNSRSTFAWWETPL